ncbi:hypothetical protein HDU92_004638 [Lobulomyces angularis]|nr:hypothetical protein HDU92_004638 [Lobulomyces angularis]
MLALKDQKMDKETTDNNSMEHEKSNHLSVNLEDVHNFNEISPTDSYFSVNSIENTVLISTDLKRRNANHDYVSPESIVDHYFSELEEIFDSPFIDISNQLPNINTHFVDEKSCAVLNQSLAASNNLNTPLSSTQFLFNSQDLLSQTTSRKLQSVPEVSQNNFSTSMEVKKHNRYPSNKLYNLTKSPIAIKQNELLSNIPINLNTNNTFLSVYPNYKLSDSLKQNNYFLDQFNDVVDKIYPNNDNFTFMNFDSYTDPTRSLTEMIPFESLKSNLNFDDINKEYNFSLLNNLEGCSQNENFRKKFQQGLSKNPLVCNRNMDYIMPIYSNDVIIARFNSKGKAGSPKPFPTYLLNMANSVKVISECGVKDEVLFKSALEMAHKTATQLKDMSNTEYKQNDTVITMLLLGIFFFINGMVENGYYWLYEVYKLAQDCNWDRSSKSLSSLPNEVKERRLIWAWFMYVSSHTSYNLIVNEADHLYMLSEDTWTQLGIPNKSDIGDPCANRISLVLQSAFLYRKSTRFLMRQFDNDIKEPRTAMMKTFSNIFPSISVEDLHDALIDWFDSVPCELKIFDDLGIFLHGEAEVGGDFESRYFRLNLAGTFILSLISLHKKNNSTMEKIDLKFKLTNNSSKVSKVTSLELILILARAISSVLKPVNELNLAEKSIMSFKRKLEFDSLTSTVIYNLSEALQEVLMVNESRGWTTNENLRKEGLKILELFFEILNLQENFLPLSSIFIGALKPNFEKILKNEKNIKVLF